MKLTPERQKIIEAMSYEELLRKWRFSPIGDPWFIGETGKFWSKRMNELKTRCDHVGVSKSVGWDA